MTVDWMAQFAPEHVKELQAYQPGKPVAELERELGITGAIKVASNENPLGPSPLAAAKIAELVPAMHLYPDAGGYELRQAIALHYHTGLDNIVLGAGSNELLYQMALAFCGPDDEVLSHQYGFLSYRLSAKVAGRRFVESAASAILGCDVDALIDTFSSHTKLVILGSPNNPTGSVVTKAMADRVLAALPARAHLIIDEAYAEYADAWPEVDHVNGAELARRDPRVVYLRTFSKIYGLAGLRVGFGVGSKPFVELMGRVTRTFNVGSLAQGAAIAALGDTAHVQQSASLARAVIEKLRLDLTEAKIASYPSLANFVLIDAKRPSAPLYQALLERGVIVRPMAAWGLANHLRVSVALPNQMPRVTQALIEVIG